jgi:catechol 2,3-dioxygenase-like lactoylglutathione lyase family enzyme
MILTEKVGVPYRLGKQIQLGHVIKNMDAALDYWTKIMGVGPFVVIETSVGDRQFFHRGKLSAVNFCIAITFMGETMIELITPLNNEPSPYQEFLASGREGLHHLGVWPDDFTIACEQLKDSGFVEVSSIRRPDGANDVIYCDTPCATGIMYELAEMTPLRAKFLAGIKTLSTHWDGSRPVRRYPSRTAFIESRDFSN